MISIFFTRANYHNNIDSYLNYLDEDGDQLGFEGAIFQITFENDRLVTNVINKDNSVETRRDAVILIEDTLSVDNDAIKNEDYLLISKEDFIKSIPSDEAIVIYHHYSSWSEKHQKIDDWFVGFEDVSSSNGQNGEAKPFMHERNIKSPFNSIMTLLKSEDENKFNNILEDLKTAFLTSKEQLKEQKNKEFKHDLLSTIIENTSIERNTRKKLTEEQKIYLEQNNFSVIDEYVINPDIDSDKLLVTLKDRLEI